MGPQSRTRRPIEQMPEAIAVSIMYPERRVSLPMMTRGACRLPRPATWVTARPRARASSGVMGCSLATPRMPSVPKSCREGGRAMISALLPEGTDGDLGGLRLQHRHPRVPGAQLHCHRETLRARPHAQFHVGADVTRPEPPQVGRPPRDHDPHRRWPHLALPPPRRNPQPLASALLADLLHAGAHAHPGGALNSQKGILQADGDRLRHRSLRPLHGDRLRERALHLLDPALGPGNVDLGGIAADVPHLVTGPKSRV